MFIWYGKSQRPQHYRCPEACGGPYHIGVNGTHNTVEGDVGAYSTVCVRVVAEYCSCKRTGYGPWYHGLTCAPWLAFSVCPLVLPQRASPVEWLQSALVAPVGEERRVGFLRTPVGDAGSESEVVLGPGLPIREAVQRRLESEASAPVGEVGRSS